LSKEIKQNGTGEACGMYELNEKCMRRFGGYTWKKETNWKTKTSMIGWY